MDKVFALSSAEKRRLKSIYQATGIERRYSVLEDYEKLNDFSFFPNKTGSVVPSTSFPSTETRMKIYKKMAPQLAVQAIQNCLSNVNILNFSKRAITHLITVSCTGMYAPGLDIDIIQQLELSTNIHRTAINFMGCHGAFNGLKMANAICLSDPNANVLVVCVELCTLHFQHSKAIEDQVSNAIFSDGAAAVLITNGEKNTKNKDPKQSFQLLDFFTNILPQSQNQMTWEIGNHGFNMQLSAYIPDLLETGIREFARLQKISLHTIKHFAIHPGSKKILEAVEKAFNIPSEKNHAAYEVLKNFGNMSSVTILFVLKSLLENMTEKDQNTNVFCCGFGPGLTIESMILRVV